MAERSPEKDGQDYFSRREPTSAHQTPRRRRVPSESYRNRLTSIQTPGSPTSPRTPRTPLLGRSFSSNFASPGIGFRQDDDFIIFEFSHRYLRAGLGGEAEPRCVYSFDPASQRRVGDYSQWLPKADDQPKPIPANSLEAWSQPYKLWEMDLRNVDLALVGDKVERALREAIRDYILVLDDSKKRKAMLLLPPIMPHALISLLCTKLFEIYPPPPSVTLLSCPVMSTAAAGLRSAMVVDVGWAATTISVIHEYREVSQSTNSRSMECLLWTTKKKIETLYQKQSQELETTKLNVSLEDAEEALFRMAWARKESHQSEDQRNGATVKVGLLSSDPPATLQIPFEKFADATETTFLRDKENSTAQDDNEMPIPPFLFNALLKLPIDIRHTCLQRIIFDGGGSRIPGLKARVLNDLSQIIATRGWDPVDNYGSGKAPKARTAQRPDQPIAKESMVDLPSRYANKDVDAESTTPAHLQPPLKDPILTRLKARSATRSSRDQATGEDAGEVRDQVGVNSTAQHANGLRSVSSLGSWAGASLLAGLRMSGLVEIERERFLQHGLHGGAQKEDEKRKSAQQQHQAQRQSLAGHGGVSSNAAWSLGVWA